MGTQLQDQAIITQHQTLITIQHHQALMKLQVLMRIQHQVATPIPPQDPMEHQAMERHPNPMEHLPTILHRNTELPVMVLLNPMEPLRTQHLCKEFLLKKAYSSKCGTPSLAINDYIPLLILYNVIK
ncbi:MAG: hypothetical protein A3E40_03795 [Candidatus Levybacteria bacterium RIFCSPHIGHO2_12_FULL_37_9]|nr:MAG: hypothetical protein A3E40_03795 [Candidatus Levybacteria bacterium RIFCSPHIGHO2_12_FULL_37_9]